MAHFTFVVPARNEADRITDLLERLAVLDVDVVVVDNGSVDDTAVIAMRHDVRVIGEPRVGKGFAVTAGARAATTEWVFLCDADIRGFDPALASSLCDDAGDVMLRRLAIRRPPESAPVTYLMASPLLQSLGILGIDEPLGGLALVRRDVLMREHLPGGWGFDVSLTLVAQERPGLYEEVLVDGITHRAKPLEAYRAMAEEVCTAILRSREVVPWDHADCTRCTQESARFADAFAYEAAAETQPTARHA